MIITSLKPAIHAKIPFRLNAYKTVPDTYGCYVLTAFNGHILYIGQSINLRRRFEEHLGDPEKTNLTQQGIAVWFHYNLSRKSAINALERGWLNAHITSEGRLPIMNSISAPV